MLDDRFDLMRFVTAQSGVHEAALAELRQGRKQSHWMWLVFPQLRGLGRSPTAQHFGIASIAEARAYLAHPILGPRLTAATQAAMAAAPRTLAAIFGSPDDMKFRSSMTLFSVASAPARSIFDEALALFCSGERDDATLALLAERD